MEWIGKIIEAAKLPTKFIVVIFLISFSLILLSDQVLKLMRLADFSERFGLYIGIIALGSGALLLIETILFFWKKINKKISNGKRKKLSMERLNRLDPAEKSVLREFYLQRQNTLKLPMDHPVVAGLIRVGVLRIVSRHGRMSRTGMLSSMKISDFIAENITCDLIDLPNGEPSQADEDFLRNNRPPFISAIQREEWLYHGM